MKDAILQHLIAQGIDAETAARAVNTMPGELMPQDDLTKAMTDLQAAFEAQIGERLEADDRLVKALATVETAEAARDTISVYADKLVAEVAAQNDALAKGMVTIMGVSRDMRDSMATIGASLATLTERLDTLQKGMDLPNPPRGTQANLFDIQPHPSDGAADDAKVSPDRLQKGITAELNAGSLTKARRSELIEAQSKAVSGVNPDTVAKNYKIKC